jgi:drug/metabolite transporter (DMT)-like permease
LSGDGRHCRARITEDDVGLAWCRVKEIACGSWVVTAAAAGVAGHARARALRAPLGAVALVAVGAATWGTDGALRAPLVTRWSPWTIVLYEHLVLSAVVAWPLLARRSALRRIPWRGWIAVVGVSWGGSALATLAFTAAFQFGNPDVVVLLQKAQPLFALLAAGAILGERPRPALLPLGVCALAGTYLLSFGWTEPARAFSGAQGKAAVLALTAAALWGTATALGRSALRHMQPDTLTGLRFVVALPLLAVIATTHGALGAPATGGLDWLRVVLLALVPGLVGLLLYYRGLRRTPASIATFAELAFPATALVVNYFALGATIDATQLVGFCVLWVTIALLHRVPVHVEREDEAVAIQAVPSRGGS